MGDAKHCVSTYTFTAKTTDYESRFRLVFVCGDANDGNADAPFAYYANGKIHLMVETQGIASIQMVDVMGRVLVCRDTPRASALSTAGMAPGVYVLRLIQGDKVRTQKIVVR